MALRKIRFKTIDELKAHIKTHEPTFYYSSQTSTVIPYDKLEEIYKDDDFFLADLSQLPSEMELLANGDLKIKGPVSWKDAREFLQANSRAIKTAPTEELALISAGAATSATGERCFHFGNLRSQISEITYLNSEAETIVLRRDKSIDHFEGKEQYDQEFAKYAEFKNAPFPRLENETDLLIGTEGQLGVITELIIETAPDQSVTHLFMLLPKWEENDAPHLEVNSKIQNFRDSVILCELIDENSFSFLPPEERPNQGMDAIFFEVIADKFDDFYEKFLLDLSFLNEELIFELTASKFHHIRASIPRAVFEENSRMGVIKKGTDVQVESKDFDKLLAIYRGFAHKGVRYNLFGHFGDSHLHFNFMPTKDKADECQKYLEQMYDELLKINSSPFAEHGIGVIKKPYIKNFWSETQFSVFKNLKEKHDPYNQFFPQGYMNIKR